MVDIQCPGRSPFPGPINSAYALCGLQGTVETVKQLTGLPVHYLVTIDYRGFIQTVDKMGGVWIDVDRRYFNRNVGTPATNFASIDVQAGYQRLCGADALDYVRYRHGDNDLVRAARQQDFLRQARTQIGAADLLGDRRALLRLLGVTDWRARGLAAGTAGHGLATAYYLAKNHGITNVAVLEKGYLGGGSIGRNTTIVRANYFLPGNSEFYSHSLKLWEGLERELNYNVMHSQRGHMILFH